MIKRLTALFQQLHTKEILCWGSGKHFRNTTYPFLKRSGLIENLKGFVDIRGKSPVMVENREYFCIGKEDLKKHLSKDTIILVAVSGYGEITRQLKNDSTIESEVIPSIFLESLYEDLLLLSVEKPPLNYRKHKEQKIPKVIHTFWFSGDPLPPKYKDCLESWKKYAGDFEIKIWDLNTYKPSKCLFFEQAISEKNWAFASDYARVDVLRRYGGVYMDLDVEMLRPIEDLLYNDGFMSFESLDRIECGSGMGAAPGNHIIDEICKSYEKRPYFKEDGSWDNSTCPVRYTQVIERHGLKKNGSFQFVEDITVYPFEVLTAKSFDSGIIYRTDHTYTIHHHSGNWVPGPAHEAMAKRYDDIRELFGHGIFNP